MFSFNEPVPIRIRDVKNRVQDDAIYSAYCKEFTLKRKISSPFKRDINPSFHFFKGNNGIMWKDHSSGESGDCILFVKKLLVQQGFGRVTLQDTLQDISNRFNLGLGIGLREPITISRIKSSEKKDIKKHAQIDIIKKPFSSIEKEYWNLFNITLPYLKMYNVGAAKKVLLNGLVSHVTSETSPVFYYYFPITNNYKVYRPYAITQKKKWLSNTSSELDIQGMFQCRFGKRFIPLLILTKAMKEVIFWRTFGIDAIAIQGENHYYNTSFIEFIKTHCKNIISFYDRDLAGVKGTLNLRREYSIPGIFINKKYKQKNITDLWLVNPKEAMLLIKQIKQKYGI